MTRGTTRAHLARAVLEGIALQVTDLLGAMAADAGVPIAELRVDGGAARNDLLVQFQADVLRTRCVRPATLETTGLGAATLAGIGVGLWSGPEAVAAAWTQDRTFEPSRGEEECARILARWAEGVARA